MEILSRVIPSHSASETMNKGDCSFAVASLLEHSAKQLVALIPQDTYQIIVQILCHHLSIPQDMKERLEAFTCTDYIEKDTNSQTAITILQLFLKKQLVLPIHIECFEILIHKSPSIPSTRSTSGSNSLELELSSLLGLDVEPIMSTESNEKIILCPITIEGQFYQDRMQASITLQFVVKEPYPQCIPELHFKDTKELQINQLNGLQIMLEETQLVPENEAPILDCVAFCQKYLEQLIAKKIKQKKRSQNKKLEIPFLPPLETFHEFQPQTKTLPLSSFSIYDIQSQLIKQVEKTLKNAKGFNHGFSLYQVESIVNPKHLKAFVEKVQELNTRENVSAVMCGYHGASRQTMESIADSGLLCPGEFTKEGLLINIFNGSRFGRGIYVSPDLFKASLYSYGDFQSNRISQIVISLVAPGRVYQCSRSWRREERYYVEGLPKDGFDSHTSTHFDEFVLFQSEQVLPVLLLTIGQTGTRNKEATFKAEKKKEITFSKIPETKENLSFVEKLDPKNCHLEFSKVPGTADYFFIKLPLSHVRKFSLFQHKKTAVHFIYLLERSTSLGKSFHSDLLPSMNDLHQTLQPSSSDAVFYGSTVETISIQNHSFFNSTPIKSMKLQRGANILAAYETAIDIAIKRKNQHMEKNSSKNQRQNILFVILLFSSSKENGLTPSKEKLILERNGKYIQANNLEIIFESVGIGKTCDTSLLTRLKVNTETVVKWYNQKQLYFVRRMPHLLPVCGLLARQLKELMDCYSSITLDDHESDPFHGFVNNLAIPPTSMAFVQTQNEESGILYRGIPPRNIVVNGFQDTRLLYVQFWSGDSMTLLPIIKRLVVDVKMAAVAHRDTTDARNTLRAIVKGVKELLLSNFGWSKHKSSTPLQIAVGMRKINGLRQELESLLNGLDEAVVLAQSKLTSDKLSKWLNSTSNMKFGGKALLRIQRTQDIITTEDILTDLRKLCKSPLQGEIIMNERRSAMSSLSATQHWNIIESAIHGSDDLSSMNTTELLYSMGMVGRCVNITRTEASNINPWVLNVEYVSHEIADSSSALCKLDAGLPHHDSTGRLAPDVMIIPDPQNPKPYERYLQSTLHKAHLGVTFARNPDITIPKQQVALVMISFVKMIEQLLQEQYRTEAHFIGIFEMYVWLLDYIQRNSKYWDTLITKLYQKKPGLYMTEAEGDDVVSVVKILVPLCCSESAFPLFVDEKMNEQLCEVALALLAEVTSRSCRVLVKSKGLFGAANSLVCQALGIKERDITIPDWNSPAECDISSLDISGDYSLTLGKKYSSRLFAKSWTNCSPQAVVATLGFAKLLFSYTGKGTIRQQMQNGEYNFIQYFIEGFKAVTMRNFITTYVPAVDPMDLQIAMYVQGLCHHSAKERKGGLPSLLHPKDVIRDIAANERRSIIKKAILQRFKHMQKELKLLKKAEKQREFLKTHNGLPRTFTWKEVSELNEKRSRTDQLELIETSGLLKHRCCYLACPQYLVNLATPADLQTGKSNGLFAHLSPFLYPKKFYTPGFHVLCKSTIPTCRSQSQFIQIMLKQLLALRNENLRAWKGVSQEEWEHYYSNQLRDYWCSFHNK